MGFDTELFDPHAVTGTAARTEAPLLVVEADGGSRGNPGHAGYGALVRDPKTGTILAEKAEYIGKASNNVAEYSGLVAGLELAHEISPESPIHVKMDSKLVVEQMSGRWQIKHADMRTLAAKARKTVDPRRVTYEWIPRERNKDADRLSNEAMDAGMAGVPWKPRREKSAEKSAVTSKGKSAGTAAAAEPAAEPVKHPDRAREQAPEHQPDQPRRTGRLHHLEVWVRDLGSARQSLGWLLERLGFTEKDSWANGVSYGGEDFYLVLEAGPDVETEPHERRRPGLNHLAFKAGTRSEVDLLARRAASHGWTLLFPERHPFAGGTEHYAAYLENADGFEVELVAEQA